MTDVTPVKLGPKFAPPSVELFAWEGLKALETGNTMDSWLFSAIGLQIEGEFDSSTVTIEGSLDGQNWHVLLDSQENHLRLSAPGMSDIGQMTRYVRPVILGGGTLTFVTIHALCRGIR